MNKDWLDIDVLEDYLDGKLDARSMHMVEKHALEDPFVAEALAGLSASPKRSLQSISLLQKQLQDRVAAQATHKKKAVVTWQRLSIAAAAAVMFISVSIVFWMKNNAAREQMAKQQPKKVDVVIAPKESQVATARPEKTTETAPPAPASVKADKEMDKAIAAAKTNAYAAVADKKKEKKEEEMAPMARKMAAPVPATAMVARSKIAEAAPQPRDGYESYRTYLEKNKRLTRNEENPFVLLTFTVDQKGKPGAFKILSHSAQNYMEEAIRLVKEGPDWVLPDQGSNEVTLQIDF
ncbi:hypothetical protein [Pedobacter sp.]|uniref:hypothetical protein n=1 Tax=Pedobacter sp. TaxID=1411316 RepID=UPI002C8BEF2C|nr:hypothetical protein [Pedobacter sp.]HWW40002.1 hypothetical protein [Pedobacter sp.]